MFAKLFINIARRIGSELLSSLKALRFMLMPRNIQIRRGVYLSGKVALGGNNLLDTNCRIIDSSIGIGSYVAPLSIVVNAQIGNYTSIGPNVCIGLGRHPLTFFSTSPFLYNKDLFKRKRKEDFSLIEIGPDCWIGAGALIMGGIKIGIGAVIGAGAVVTKDVDDFAIVTGVPAKLVRYRFKEETMRQIKETQWWTLPHDDLIAQADALNAKFGALENNG
jgi:acetyltransferase-like isoleucine patch superfamily enzyme